MSLVMLSCISLLYVTILSSHLIDPVYQLLLCSIPMCMSRIEYEASYHSHTLMASSVSCLFYVVDVLLFRVCVCTCVLEDVMIDKSLNQILEVSLVIFHSTIICSFVFFFLCGFLHNSFRCDVDITNISY